MTDDVPPLSRRLRALAFAIEPGSRVADLGSDHGLLPLWLAASGRASFCLATEPSEARLRRVARPPASAPWADRLGYRSGDGLAAVHPSDRIDTVVLAGLGGASIVRILSAGPSGPLAGRLVLQPRSELAKTRAWLLEGGWRLVSETLTWERGRCHATLAAERGEDGELYTHATLGRDDLLEAGPLLVRSGSGEVHRFWLAERGRFASIRTAGGRDGLARAERILAAISTRAG